MDSILAKVTQQAMNYAIRSGIAITSGYALQQCSRFLQTKSGEEKDVLESLRRRLESKIRIISPAIDMIELIAARGNTSLESAVSLTKSLRWEIQGLGVRLATAAENEELSVRHSRKAQSETETQLQLNRIIADMKNLLERIEDAVPLINLAITTSGASLSTSLPLSVSPSRLLQASTFLTAGDTQYVTSATRTQIGPTFTLSMYMLFAGHAHRPKDEEGLRNTTWKEVIHKLRLKLMRIPIDEVFDLPHSSSIQSNASVSSKMTNGRNMQSPQTRLPADILANEFAYQLLLIEDLEDDRVHTFEEDEEQPGPFLGVELAGIREAVPVHEISKVFYADTGKILNIGADGGINSPVLLLKRDIRAAPPRRMMEQENPNNLWDDEIRSAPDNEDSTFEKLQEVELSENFPEDSMSPKQASQSPQPWRIPSDLDPEWIAFEVYSDVGDSESESEIQEDHTSARASKGSISSHHFVMDRSVTSAFSQLEITSSSSLSDHKSTNTEDTSPTSGAAFNSLNPSVEINAMIPPIQTSLSLLDMMIRLMSLQQFEQSSHLAIPDELINFFLQESATTGAAQGDSPERRRIRREARERVGFDPYAESPIKGHRRQTSYQDQNDADKYGRWRESSQFSDSIVPTTETLRSNMPSHESQHSSSSNYMKSDTSTPLGLRSSPSSSPILAQQAFSPSTPPSTAKSRQKYLGDDAQRAYSLRSSPLTQSISAKDSG